MFPPSCYGNINQNEKEEGMKKQGIVGILLLAVCMILAFSPAMMAAETGKKGAQAQVTAGQMKVNINSADLDALCQIPGIGPKMAERIISYRKANGRFKRVEDLLNVKGIGEKKLARMKGFLAL